MDHLKLLCDIGELNWIFSDHASTKSFLQKIVAIVAVHMQAAVCSIYLYDEEKKELVLKATKGLHPDSVERVKLNLGEGLVGLALKELRPVCEPVASASPHFKFFPGIFEERYESFLVVPILRGTLRIGALTVQRGQTYPFGDQDIMALRAVASQLANIIENARLLLSLQEFHQGRSEREEFCALKFIKGKVASEGFALAEGTVVDKDQFLSRLFHLDVARSFSLDDFYRALALTESQLKNVQRLWGERLSEDVCLIFTAHLLMLNDKSFAGAMIALIEAGENPFTAILKVAKHCIDLFSQSMDAYIREKAQDLKDLTVRLIGNLVSDRQEASFWQGKIIIAKELFPSDLLKMCSDGVAGLILVGGGVTSHLAILARSLCIPMVIVDVPQLLSIPEKTTVLLDAEVGNVYLDPDQEVVAYFQVRNLTRTRIAQDRESMRPVTLTKDGIRIRLLVNINLLTDLTAAREFQAEGIGLYRTEFPFMIRSTFPTEDEQFTVYRKLVEGMSGQTVTFRTLDIGGDKVLSYYPTLERNPSLGLRSIRFCLQHQDVFSQQLRAILRAGVGTPIQIMFPMISSLEEFVEARQILISCIEELKCAGTPHNDRPLVGAMIELPALSDLLDDLAREADFFSIGTNDLIQYTLAVDRTNEKVADWYVPHHPAVLRTLKKVVDAALHQGIEVSICGDMAYEEQYLPFLVGIGVRILSVAPLYLPRVQRTIAQIDVEEARAFAETILAQNRASTIVRLLQTRPTGMGRTRSDFFHSGMMQLATDKVRG
jgi:phosphotransferase system enzyme I (PtsP)